MLDMLASFLFAIPAGMGVGGGGLLVLYLTLFQNMEPAMAQGINLFFYLASVAASLPGHIRSHRIRWRPLLLLLAGGLPCAFFASRLAQASSPAVLRILLGAFLVLGGLFALLRPKK